MLKDYLVKEDGIKSYLEECAQQIAAKKKLAIWGAARGGAKCMEFLEKYQLLDREIFFLDNDPKKQGKTYYGKMVFSPALLEKEDVTDTLVAITCADCVTVEEQLATLQFFRGGGEQFCLI